MHHREQHLAERFGLRFFAAFKMDLVELGDAVDDFGDIITEAFREIFLGDRRVFDDVVKDGGNNGVGVKPQIGKHFGSGDRVCDVGLAGFALLTSVRFGAELRGGADALDLVGT